MNFTVYKQRAALRDLVDSKDETLEKKSKTPVKKKLKNQPKKTPVNRKKTVTVKKAPAKKAVKRK
jgi:hypothetical protein